MVVLDTGRESDVCLSDDELAGFVAGQLERGVADRLAGHLDGCAACRRLVSVLARAEAGPTREAPLVAGQVLGRFTLVRPLGRGSMGEVWAARDTELDREVALKLLHLHLHVASLGSGAAIRLRREAQAMARLDHPNVVAIYDLGAAGGRVFCAMRLVDGVTLRAWLTTPRRWRDVLAVMIAAGRGIAAAHAAGVVHRDIKPENILIARDGHALVTDFGLAKLAEERSAASAGAPEEADGGAGLDVAARIDDRGSPDAGDPRNPLDGSIALAAGTAPAAIERRAGLPVTARGGGELAHAATLAESASLTRTGALIGTPVYMAPEQLAGGDADACSDQFGFCVALWEAVCGSRPFAGARLSELQDAVRRGALVEPGPRRAPRWLLAIVRRGLAARPEDRWPSMDELLAALGRAFWTRRRRRIAIAGAATAIAGIAILGFTAGQRVAASEPCGAGEPLIAALWDDATRGRVHDAFRRTGQSFAEDAFARVDTGVRARLTGWSQTYRDNCEATHVRHEQSEAMLDLRGRCLTNARIELTALIASLGQADSAVVQRAPRAVLELADTARCSDPAALGAATAPPQPALARDVDAMQWKFRRFAGSEGLRNLAISSIAQDGDGALWVGTNDGVYRFHGERFTRVSVGDGLNSINVVATAPDGHVCAGGNHGLACWDGTRFSQTIARGLPALSINAMVSFAGKLWVGTVGAGLYVQRAGGGFSPAPGWTGSPVITALWADANGLVVGDGPTVQLSAGDGVWRPIGDVGLGREPVTGALRDRGGALWIRTPTRMWSLAANAAQAIDLSAGLPAGYDVSALPTGMAIGPRGDVLVATDTGLAYRERDRWRTIPLAGAGSTPAEPTRTLLVDREGTVWIGASGLFQLRGRGLVEHHDAASGLPGDVVWTYQRDRQGTLWVGTNRCLARATAERWECMPGTEGHVVRSAVFPPQGGVFIGGPPSDLLYIDASGHATAVAFDQPNSFVVALALGPEGDLWIGTRTGLYRLAGAVVGPIERVIVPGIRADHGFQSFAVTGGRLWTAAPEGIAVRDGGLWKLFDKTAGFRDTAMRYVAARSDGGLCVTYLEPIGLSCFRYDGGTISNVEHIGSAEGLTTGMVYFLGEDRQRRLWVGTGDGVDIVTPHGVDHLDDTDGLAGNDSSATAFIMDPDGSVWLGETGGATHVFAQYYRGPPEPPRSAFVDGQLGDRSIHDARALEVPHDRNTLALEFTSSSLLDEARVGYEVRLTPLETAWNATHQREARYPALAPGTYRFEVRAHIGAGPAGPPAVLELTVLPAWWQTRWFLALASTTATLVLGAGFTWWLRRRTRRFHARSDVSARPSRSDVAGGGRGEWKA